MISDVLAVVQVTDKAKHYGLATKFDEAIDPSQGIAFQYELKLVDGLTCGGAYLKFITDLESFDAAALKEDTPYTVMFGPDKCGSTNKVCFMRCCIVCKEGLGFAALRQRKPAVFPFVELKLS